MRVLLSLEAKLIGVVVVVSCITLRPIVPIVGYALNYDYISNVLCVNKDKPAMSCHGKCYLAKELSEVTEQADGAAASKSVDSKTQTPDLYTIPLISGIPSLETIFCYQFYPNPKVLATSDYANGLLRPPIS